MSDEGERAARRRGESNATERDVRGDPGHDDCPEAGDHACRCVATFHDDQLIVDSEACPGRGALARRPDCRETVVAALSKRDATAICTRVDDVERACGVDATGLLVAAGRFVALCDAHDPALAARTQRDPLVGARLAAGRPDPLARIAAETGLVEGAARFGSYRDAFGDRATYRVRDPSRGSDGAYRFATGTEREPDRAERTARALDDGGQGDPSPGHDASPFLPHTRSPHCPPDERSSDLN